MISRYAKALLNISADKSAELNQIVSLLQSNMRFFASPHISVDEKKSVIRKIFEKKIDRELLSFLLLLIEKRRFNHLEEIVQSYSEMAAARTGALKGCLTVAKPLEPGIKENLQKKLEKIYQKSIELDELVDPRLIGGGTLTIGNRLADFSVKERLAKLERDLLAINVRWDNDAET